MTRGGKNYIYFFLLSVKLWYLSTWNEYILYVEVSEGGEENVVNAKRCHFINVLACNKKSDFVFFILVLGLQSTAIVPQWGQNLITVAFW